MTTDQHIRLRYQRSFPNVSVFDFALICIICDTHSLRFFMSILHEVKVNITDLAVKAVKVIGYSTFGD